MSFSRLSVLFSSDALSTSLSTIFSILFAATFARLLRSFALWLLERGSKIGLLDQFVGSLSVSSALMTQISTGIQRTLGAHFIGLMLILLWLLSPIGSQAILRISSLRLTYNIGGTPILYLNVSAWYNIGGNSSESQLVLATSDTLLNAALVSPMTSKQQLTDSWGNVKIPQFSRMPINELDPHGWRPATITSVDDFSSLIGLPLLHSPSQVINQSRSLWNPGIGT